MVTERVVSELDGTYSTTASSIEQIWDEIGRMGFFNPCTHNRSIPVVIPNGPVHHCCDKRPNFASYRPGQDVGWTWCGYADVQAYGTFGIEKLYGGSIIPLPSLPSVDWGSVVRSVSDRLDGSMAAKTSLAVELVQGAQTIRILKNPFGLRKAKVPKNLTLLGGLKSLGNAWLEYRYGWNNLYMDIKAIAKMYNKVKSHMAYLDRTRGSFTPINHKQVDVGLVTPLNSTVNMSGGQRVTRIIHSGCRVERTCSFSVEIYRDPTVALLSPMMYAMQYSGCTDVVQALWDLLPYSFVVDWFCNLGVLGNLTDALKWQTTQLRRVGYSTKVDWTHSTQVEVGTYQPWYGTDTVKWTLPHDVCKQTYVRSPGFPPGYDQGGTFNGSFRSINLADGLALVVQRI